MKEFGRFYWLCFKTAFPGAWGPTWITATVLGIVLFSIAVVTDVLNPFMNVLLGIIPLTIFVVGMVAGPLVAAFRMYRQLEERGGTREKELFKELDELRQRSAARETELLQEISRLRGPRPIQLSAHQLWEAFRSDPVGSQTRLRMVQVSGQVISIGQGGCEVHLNAEQPVEPSFESVEGAWKRVALAALRTPRVVTCYFAKEVAVCGNVLIEGEIGEYKPQSDGGTITIINCRLIG